MSQNRDYELVYIVSPETSEQDDHRSAHADRADRPAVPRTIEKSENWGRRKLAYEIGHHREGTYVVETHPRIRRADEGDRSPPSGD